MKTVLLIDDNDDYRETVRCVLEKEGLEVVDTDCPRSAFELLQKMETPDIIVCDLHMPFATGAESDEFKTSFEVGVKTVHELAWVYPDIPVLAMTALEEIDIAKIKQYLSPIPTYQKPIRMKQMVELISCFLVCQDFGGVQ